MQKFIITSNGLFKYGDVRLHKHLLEAGEHCLGGGFYEFDFVSGRLLLSGSSYDFGVPRWHDLDALKMPAAFRGLRILYEGEELDKLVKINYI